MKKMKKQLLSIFTVIAITITAIPATAFTPNIQNNKPEISDVLEILKYLAGLPNQVEITDGIEPTVDDAIEVLKMLAGLPSVYDKTADCNSDSDSDIDSDSDSDIDSDSDSDAFTGEFTGEFTGRWNYYTTRGKIENLNPIIKNADDLEKLLSALPEYINLKWQKEWDDCVIVTHIFHAGIGGLPEVNQAKLLQKNGRWTIEHNWVYNATVKGEPMMQMMYFAVPKDVFGNNNSVVYERIGEIFLKASVREISTKEKNPVVYFYADTNTNFKAENITLVNAVTNQKIAVMLDDGKYAVSGDDIMGDGVYSCKVTVDNSEKGDLLFYAVCDETNKVSNTVKIQIWTPWTDKELNDMQKVWDIIDVVMKSPEYAAMSLEEKSQAVLGVLYQLEEDGLIHSILTGTVGSSGHSFEFASGGIGGIKLEPFDPMLNGIHG